MSRRFSTYFQSYLFWGAWLLGLVLVGCSPKKHLIPSEGDQGWMEVSRAAQSVYIDSLEQHVQDFQTWQARSKGYLTVTHLNKPSNHEVNLQIRMKTNEIIWISATALMGLEVARIKITPDSIHVVNRMESLYLAESFSSAATWLGPDMDFEGLQQLLAGQGPVSPSLTRWVMMRDSVGMVRLQGGITGTGEMDYDDRYRLRRWKGERLEVLHAYEPGDSTARFPAKSTWAVEGASFELLTTLEYNQIEEDRPLNFPFSIPNGYQPMH